MWQRPRACILLSSLLRRQPRGERLDLVDRLGHVGPRSLTAESCEAPCLRGCGAVQRQPGVASAMIQAQKSASHRITWWLVSPPE